MRKAGRWLLQTAMLVGLIGAPIVAGRASWRRATEPSYTTLTTSISSTANNAGQGGQSATIVRSQATLAEVNGRGTYLLLLVPVILAALPLIFRLIDVGALPQAAAAAPLLGFAYLTGFSIGLPYLLAAGLALFGVAASALEESVA